MVNEKGTEKHQTANDCLTVRFYWGNKKKSKLLVAVQVVWKPLDREPILYVETPRGVTPVYIPRE